MNIVSGGKYIELSTGRKCTVISESDGKVFYGWGSCDVGQFKERFIPDVLTAVRLTREELKKAGL